MKIHYKSHLLQQNFSDSYNTNWHLYCESAVTDGLRTIFLLSSYTYIFKLNTVSINTHVKQHVLFNTYHMVWTFCSYSIMFWVVRQARQNSESCCAAKSTDHEPWQHRHGWPSPADVSSERTYINNRLGQTKSFTLRVLLVEFHHSQYISYDNYINDIFIRLLWNLWTNKFSFILTTLIAFYQAKVHFKLGYPSMSMDSYYRIFIRPLTTQWIL